MPKSFLLAVLVISTLLLGCGTLARFGGDPSKTGLPGSLSTEVRRQAVALCYNRENTDREALQAAARELCREPGSTVTYWSEDWNLNNCPLLKKRRAVFLCKAP